MSPARFAVIGNPIAHSLSPTIHAAFARATGIALTYERIEAPTDPDARPFIEAVQKFFGEGGQGLNVTAPFKHPAFAFAQATSTPCQRAQAANTLTRVDWSRWHADNTDGVGLTRDLLRLFGKLDGARIFIHGAGGATAGVLADLLAQGSKLFLYNRTADKAQALAESFADLGPITVLPSFAVLPEQPFDLVIHATSVRSLPTPTMLWPDALYHPSTFYYDIVYSNSDTAFLQWVKTHGRARCCDGLGMLVEQAAESFRIWHGVLPETEGVRQLLRMR